MKAMVRSVSIITVAWLFCLAAGCATKKVEPPPKEEVSQTTLKTEEESSSLEQLASFYETQEESQKAQTAAADSAEIPPPPAGKEWHVGKILVVNEASRFALVDSRVGRRPPKGALLVTKGSDGKVLARMTTSPETGREFVAVDLQEGLPVVGDAVYWISGQKNEKSHKPKKITN